MELEQKYACIDYKDLISKYAKYRCKIFNILSNGSLYQIKDEIKKVKLAYNINNILNDDMELNAKMMYIIDFMFKEIKDESS